MNYKPDLGLSLCEQCTVCGGNTPIVKLIKENKRLEQINEDLRICLKAERTIKDEYYIRIKKLQKAQKSSYTDAH